MNKDLYINDEKENLLSISVSSTVHCDAAVCVVYLLWYTVKGFKSFDSDDQATIIRLGQSASRVVLAAVHWYDVDLKLFRNFLAWRSSSMLASSSTDLFKQQLTDYAEGISLLDVDPIEAALLNSLLVVATGISIISLPT